jgi:hypothetical protein
MQEEEIDNTTPGIAKWSFIPYAFSTNKSDFYEDNNGNVAYRNASMLYLFDDKGVLKHTEPIDVPNNESIHLNFVKDGSFFLKMKPFNTFSSDFIIYYRRLGPFSYSNPTMIDIRKLDSLNRYIAEYYIHDITTDNVFNTSSTNAWILASRYPDVNALMFNRNPQPVLIGLSNTMVGPEHSLPKDVLHARVATSSSSFLLFAPEYPKTFTFDKGFDFTGTQQANMIVPDVNVLGSFVVKTANGYYLSDNMIQLRNKILGVPFEAQILHSKDSLLHIYVDGHYATINAISGQELFRFNARSEKMPISADTVNTVDYYRTQNGVSYYVTSRGIVVAN